MTETDWMTNCTRSTCGHLRVHHLHGQSCIIGLCPCTQFINRSFDEPEPDTVATAVSDPTRFVVVPELDGPTAMGAPDPVALDEGYLLTLGARAVLLTVAEARTVRDALSAWLVDVEIVEEDHGHSAGCLCSDCCDERKAICAALKASLKAARAAARRETGEETGL